MTFKFLLCLVWVTLTTAATTSTTSLPGTISTSTITPTSAITTSNSSNYTASGTGFVTTMITTITSTISPDAPASTLDSATVQVGSGTSLTQPFSSTDGSISTTGNSASATSTEQTSPSSDSATTSGATSTSTDSLAQTSSSSISANTSTFLNTSAAPASVEDANKDMLNFLNDGLAQSGMVLIGEPQLKSDLTDPNRMFCGINAMVNDTKDVGTSFPKCLLEVAVNEFCTRTTDETINTAGPNSTGPFTGVGRATGLWSTYKFTGYSISGLYIGLEIIKRDPSYNEHEHTIDNKDGAADPDCKGVLMSIVEDCDVGTITIKYGGVTTRTCEVWAIYPISPFVDVVGGEFPEPVEMHNDHHTYYGCEGIDLAGLPVITGTMLPTTALQWPLHNRCTLEVQAGGEVVLTGPGRRHLTLV